jgi:hypothetical protein
MPFLDPLGGQPYPVTHCHPVAPSQPS